VDPELNAREFRSLIIIAECLLKVTAHFNGSCTALLSLLGKRSDSPGLELIVFIVPVDNSNNGKL
jgi:hypothetical protein